MIKVTRKISLREDEIQLQFIRASGPGGQNVNKVATAAQLRFNVNSPALSDEVRERLMKLAGKQITKEGDIVLTGRKHRTQERNRHDVIRRLVTLIQKATEKPKPRKKITVSKAAKQRRLEEKRRRGERKKLRSRRSF